MAISLDLQVRFLLCIGFNVTLTDCFFCQIPLTWGSPSRVFMWLEGVDGFCCCLAD